MDDKVKSQGRGDARTPGAKRAGPGEYYFDLTKVNSIMGARPIRACLAAVSRATA